MEKRLSGQLLSRWSYAILAFAGSISILYLSDNSKPSVATIAWLLVGALAGWGFGISIHSLLLRQEFFRLKVGQRIRPVWESWLWLLISGVELLAACWKLGSLTLNLFPVVGLLAAAVPLAEGLGWLSIASWAGAFSLPTLIGWAALRQSLFQRQDLPAWLMIFFLVLWIAGSESIGEASQKKLEGDEISFRKRFDWARIFQMLSLVPLFFLGQQEGLGLIFGIILFVILMLSERLQRSVVKKDPAFHTTRTALVNFSVSLLLLVGCLMGGWLN